MLKKSKIFATTLLALVMLFALCSSVFAATVGQQLTTQEDGWRRYDDKASGFQYTNFTNPRAEQPGNYQGTISYSNDKNPTIDFKFYGTKLRIITQTYYMREASNTILIDGVSYSYSELTQSLNYQIIVFEKNDLPLGIHSISISKTSPGNQNLTLDAIDIDATGYMIDSQTPYDLTATTVNQKVNLSWYAVPNATGYNIKRSLTSGGPYTTVATSVTGTTYTDSNVTNGITYYYVVTAVNASGESVNSNEASATLPLLKPQLNVVIAEEKVNVGQEFTSNIVLKNTTGIYAEDFTVQYDNVHLEYLGFEEVPGYKVYNKPADTDGKLRFVVASQGSAYGINAETTFLKLKFKAKAVGTGKVDATKGRIADTTTEFDLEEANCLEDTVIIENQDVNMSGEYTLLDLAIDAAHFGELGSTVDPTKYVANQVGDDTVRDEDLVFIVAQMLANTSYAPNNK